MATKKSPKFLALTIIFMMIISYQNCSQQFNVSNDQASQFWADTQACFSNTNANACVYDKSATATAQAAVDAGAANQYQKKAVNISELNSAIELTSNSFTVRAGSKKATPKNGSWKFKFNEDMDSLSQVNAYFYLTDFKNFVKNRTGVFHAENKSIKVNTSAGFTAWSDKINEIDLESHPDKLPAATDASVVINLLAQANIYYANSGATVIVNSTTTQKCTNKNGKLVFNGCCTSNVGCALAISAGAADYLTAIYFNTNTAIGENWVQNSSGVATCGVSRDVSKNSSLKNTQAFAACTPYGGSGNIYAMGSLYASIWWEARKKAPNKVGFDTFFMKHLELITADDTFSSIKSKLQNLDQSQFSSSYYNYLQTEFNNRGL